MRTVIQRVREASVTVEDEVISQISNGLLVLVGIEDSDTDDDINYLSKKITNLRIFNDENGVMNKSVVDIQGELLLVSQFTLHASTNKGNRPSYIRASKPDFAVPMYKKFVATIRSESGLNTLTGKFGAMMDVRLLNDGPVTIIIDSKERDF